MQERRETLTGPTRERREIMSKAKWIFGAIATVIAIAPGVNAAPAPVKAASAPNVSVAAVASGADIVRMSDTALQHILDKAHLQLLPVTARAFVQGGPGFIQWRGQVHTQVDDTRPSPAGDVHLAFEHARTRIG